MDTTNLNETLTGDSNPDYSHLYNDPQWMLQVYKAAWKGQASADETFALLQCIEAQSAALKQAVDALEILSNEARNFSVSGVYFDEECMGHKGLELADAALAASKGLVEGCLSKSALRPAGTGRWL